MFTYFIADAVAAAGLLRRPDALAHPEPMIAALRHLPLLTAWVMMAGGAIVLSHGVRFYRVGFVAAATAAGAWAGYHFGKSMGGEVVLALCLGVMAAALAWPMMRYLVVALAALAGAVVAVHAFSAAAAQLFQQTVSAELAWLVAAAGLTPGAMLAMRLARLGVMTATSVAGAVLMAVGLTAVLLHLPLQVSGPTVHWLTQQQFALPAAVAGAALLGLIMQRSVIGPTDDETAEDEDDASPAAEVAPG